MTSFVLRLYSFAALVVTAIFAAGLALADDNDATLVLEFPEETEALVAATAALFDEIQSQDKGLGDARPVIRLPDLAQKVRVEASAVSDPLTLHGPLRHLTGYRINCKCRDMQWF